MELKGQMIHLPESSSLIFLGSPRVDKLEELMGRGLHLSDIPIHDATRDVILVGEQAKAQDGLKKRMDKLKVEWLLLNSGSIPICGAGQLRKLISSQSNVLLLCGFLL